VDVNDTEKSNGFRLATLARPGVTHCQSESVGASSLVHPFSFNLLLSGIGQPPIGVGAATAVMPSTKRGASQALVEDENKKKSAPSSGTFTYAYSPIRRRQQSGKDALA
jgi:hypothetical protein